MVEVVVTGIGLISALGTSLESSWQQLISGKSGIHLHQPFGELSPRPLALIGKQPAQLETLTGLVVAAALEDAALVAPLPDCGVVIGSSRSHQASWEKLAREFYRTDPPQPPHDKGGLGKQWLEALPHMNAIASARSIGDRKSVV